MKSAEDLASANSGAPDELDEDWLQNIDLRIAGMPLMWKAINAVLILAPKILVWKLTVQTGITFLMETASISDLVVNSIALTFILSIDEMICETLTSQSTLSMLSRCKDYPLFDPEVTQLSDEEITAKYGGEKLDESIRCWDIIAIVFPTRCSGYHHLFCLELLSTTLPAQRWRFMDRFRVFAQCFVRTEEPGFFVSKRGVSGPFSHRDCGQTFLDDASHPLDAGSHLAA
eukprot:Skav205791  [mRNA]  locus=scaffold340:336619:354110:+ [translate_table: standard]